MSNGDGLPRGWARARVKELMTLVNGFAFKPSHWKGTGLPIIRIQNLNNPDAPYNYCPDEIPEKFLVNYGDLLFAWSGTPGTSFGAHIWRGDKAWLNQHIFRVDFDRDNLDEQFLRLAINRNLDDYIRAAHGGAGLAHITKGTFESSELRIAPIDEQRRIVGKLEELLSDLDVGVAALQRVRANLKRYRASVLKSAVEGRLTEAWRSQNPPKEPASELLARILKERRKRWQQQQLATYKAKGKNPPKGWQSKYKEPVEPETANLPDLPKDWCWVTWETILAYDGGAFKRGPFGSTLKKAFFVEHGYKVYEQYCPINDDCSFERYYITEEKFRELESFAVQAGDYLVSCSGVTLGRITQVPRQFREGVINQALLRVRLNNTIIDGGYFLRLFRSPFFQRLIFAASTGSAIPNVKGVKELKAIPVPLPPLEEQRRIASDIDCLLSALQAVDAAIEANRKRAARLRQSILKRAFEGKLVPQDQDDEPASKLLGRIRTARPGKTKAQSKRKKPTRQKRKEI